MAVQRSKVDERIFRTAPLLRSSRLLQDLPVEYRWEVMRRHPYYLQLWEPARDHRNGVYVDLPSKAFGNDAVLILQGIGFTGEPVPPSFGAEALKMDQLSQAWRNGAIAPVTIRGLVGILLRNLPPTERKYIGELLIRSAEPCVDEKIQKYELLSELMGPQHSSMDQMFTAPIFGVNLNSPLRAMVEAIGHLVGELKRKLNIFERRRQDALLPDYLNVWDLREGWKDCEYDIPQEHSFREISRLTATPERTAANRYYSAFELISGHSYSFENWVKLFIVVKLNTLLGPDALKRRKVHSSPRAAEAVEQVPESFLSPGGNMLDGGVATHMADSFSEAADVELLMDLCKLIKDGYTNVAIIRKLDLSDLPDRHNLLDYMRARKDDCSAA